MTTHLSTPVPAATVERQLPDVVLGAVQGGRTVHALVDGRPSCRVRARKVVRWAGHPPSPLCRLCAVGLVPATHRGPFWKATGPELAELSLYAADQLVRGCREGLAELRSKAIADGSFELPVDGLDYWQATRGTEPVLDVGAGRVILGQLYDRVAPAPFIEAAREELRRAQDIRDDEAHKRRLTASLEASTQRRVEELTAAAQAKRAQQEEQRRAR